MKINWLIKTLQKEARRFRQNDDVRYFTQGRKGKNNVVLTPVFQKGRVVDYDAEQRRYKIMGEDNEELFVHPRNLVPSSVSRSTSESTSDMPVISEPVDVVETPIL